MIYAVIDTNVLVSALKTRHEDAATAKVLGEIVDGRVTMVVCREILEEYEDVLSRPRLALDGKRVEVLMRFIRENALELEPESFNGEMADEDDRVFYEVALAAQPDDALLVTGNIAHFPKIDFVVTPAEFMALLDKIGAKGA